MVARLLGSAGHVVDPELFGRVQSLTFAAYMDAALRIRGMEGFAMARGWTVAGSTAT